MGKIKEVLSRIRKGTTVDALTRELNMNKSLLRAMIEFSINRGYLKEINTQYSCINCLSGTRYPTECYKSPTKMYALTARGLELISSNNIR
ncbi:hypothetical protein KAT51_00845 [bacterium]|nr:hypothetical protein [bacterium]